MRVILVAALLGIVLASSSSATDKLENSARSLIESGIRAYQEGSASDAMKVWLKGSAMEGNPQALTQANNLRQIEDFYGKPIGYDLVKEYEAGPKVRVVYFTVNYEKGVAFGVFQAYRNSDGQWINTQFKFHTDASQIFPQCLLTE